MICAYSLRQLIFLMDELAINIGINWDLVPQYLKYSRFIVLSIISVALIIVSIFLYRQKFYTEYSPKFKSFRLYLVGLLIIGIVFRLIETHLATHRIEVFNEYLERHETEMFDLYAGLFVYPKLFYIIIFIYFLLYVFILTGKKERNTNTNRS